MSEPSAGGTPRSRGIAKMEEVYGFSVDPDQLEGPYVAFTVDHLFGTVWSRDALGVRDRRLTTIGVLAALGQASLVEIQFRSALERRAHRGAGARARAAPDPLHRMAALDRGQRRGRKGHRPAPYGGGRCSSAGHHRSGDVSAADATDGAPMTEGGTSPARIRARGRR